MNYVEIPLIRLAGSLLLVGVAVLISYTHRLRLGRDLILGAFRAAVQLVAIGFALVLVFNREHPVLTALVFATMLGVASWTAARRVAEGPGWKRLLPRTFASILAASAVSLIPVLIWIIPTQPLFSARYAIPLGGMMLASAMNSVTLVLERMFSSALRQRLWIDQALALGASPAQAMAPFRKQALRAALIPTINGLLTVGLVQLPGMMTGQIMSGTSPDQAIRYQLIVMYQLVAVASVAGVAVSWLSQGLLFDSEQRLLHDPSK